MDEALKILCIEDDPDIAFLIDQSLRRDPQISVRTVRSGHEALQMLALGDWRPDCFLVDYRLPDINGVMVLAEIRNLAGYEDTPAIFLTANPAVTIAARAGLGSVGTIPKPFSILTLAQQIRGMLPGRRRAEPSAVRDVQSEA